MYPPPVLPSFAGNGNSCVCVCVGGSNGKLRGFLFFAEEKGGWSMMWHRAAGQVILIFFPFPPYFQWVGSWGPSPDTVPDPDNMAEPDGKNWLRYDF